MAATSALATARRFRAEAELREVVASGTAERIELACKRAKTAGVSVQEVERALALAERLRLGGQLSVPAAGREAPTLLAARRFRSEEELGRAKQQGNPTWIEAACKRAAVAGVPGADIEEAMAIAQSLRAGEEGRGSGTSVPSEALVPPPQHSMQAACLEIEASLAEARSLGPMELSAEPRPAP